jgi:hypothetical protein
MMEPGSSGILQLQLANELNGTSKHSQLDVYNASENFDVCTTKGFNFNS